MANKKIIAPRITYPIRHPNGNYEVRYNDPTTDKNKVVIKSSEKEAEKFIKQQKEKY